MENFEIGFRQGGNMENRYTRENLFLLVPESELDFETFLSSGPGGQNVQKNESGVRLRWSLDSSANLSAEEKAFVASRLRNEKDMMERLARKGVRFDYQFTKGGELLIAARHDTREQEQNKKHVTEKFYTLLEEALKPEPKRKPPKTGSPKLRMEEKRRVKQKKEFRKNVGGGQLE